MLDEQAFQKCADAALDDLYGSLADAAEQHDFDADFSSGALTVEFEEPRTKFVVSPNSPVRQIWVSAHSRSFKLDWDAGRNTFVLLQTGQDLKQLIAEQIGIQLGESIAL